MDFTEFVTDRQRHIERDLDDSDYTARLYRRFRRHLGAWRYRLFLKVQALLAPEPVRQILGMERSVLLLGACRLYSQFSRTSVRTLVQQVLLPPEYRESIRRFDRLRGRHAEPGLSIGIEN